MNHVVTLVCWTLIVALSAAGVVQLVRQVPWVEKQMMKGKRPWVCNLCMSWWTSLFATALYAFFENMNWVAGIPAFACTLIFINVLGSPKSKPEFGLEIALADIPEVPGPEVRE